MRAVAVKSPDFMRSTWRANSPRPEASRAPAMKFKSSSVKKSETTSTTTTSSSTSSSTCSTNFESMPTCSTPSGLPSSLIGIETMYCSPTRAAFDMSVVSCAICSTTGLRKWVRAPMGSLPRAKSTLPSVLVIAM